MEPPEALSIPRGDSRRVNCNVALFLHLFLAYESVYSLRKLKDSVTKINELKLGARNLALGLGYNLAVILCSSLKMLLEPLKA